MEAVHLPTEKEEASEENGGGGASEAPEAAAVTAYNMPLAENEEEEDGEFPADFDRLWKLAHDNPQDFSSWTDLLQYSEQEVRRAEGTDKIPIGILT